MAKKMNKAMKQVKKGVEKFIDEAKDSSNKAVDFISDKMK